MISFRRTKLIVILAFGFAVPAFLYLNRQPPQNLSTAEKQIRIDEMYQQYKKWSFADVPDLSARAAFELLQAGKATLVDVRTQEEMDVSMIAGAITKAQFEKERSAYTDKLIIPYCTIGARSGKYTQELIDSGIAAKNLAGSVLAWSHENFAFELDGKATNRVHVFDPYWDLLAKDFVAVY